MTSPNSHLRRTPEPVLSTPRMENVGAVVLTGGGLIASFGLASCCALPIFLGAAGLSTAWLGVVAAAAFPHRLALLLIAPFCFAAAGVLIVRQRKACLPTSICA